VKNGDHPGTDIMQISKMEKSSAGNTGRFQKRGKAVEAL
jgi:hypothetical protein